MPSPVAHIAAGYIVYRSVRRCVPQLSPPQLESGSDLLVLSMALSMLPDLDSLLGFAAADIGRFHNNGTHSLIVGLGVALVIGGWMRWKRRASVFPWFFVSLLCYELHVLMDSATVGRGVMALWPLSSTRFRSPLSIFYGLHWSEGVFSIRHLWTIGSEALMAALLIWVLHRLLPKSGVH